MTEFTCWLLLVPGQKETDNCISAATLPLTFVARLELQAASLVPFSLSGDKQFEDGLLKC